MINKCSTVIKNLAFPNSFMKIDLWCEPEFSSKLSNSWEDTLKGALAPHQCKTRCAGSAARAWPQLNKGQGTLD